MSKVICIDNSGWKEELTLNKIYDIVKDGRYYKIKDNLNITRDYYKYRFITLQEFRNNKLNKIL